MRTRIVIVCVLLLAAMMVRAAITSFGQYVIINTSTSAPAQLTNVSQQVRAIILWGKKDFQTDNVGTVYVGEGNSADGKQGWHIVAGGQMVILPTKTGDFLQLSNFWFDVATANDGLLVTYE